MALGPKQMGAAILRNLSSKTGKSVEEWVKITRASGLREKKAVIDYLKREHGLGHFQAQKIHEVAQGSDAYANADDFVDMLFDAPAVKALYTAAHDAILQTGDDIRVQPCKTYIPFYRNQQFALLLPGKAGTVILALNLPDGHGHAPYSPADGIGTTRINAKTTLTKTTDLTSAITDAIEVAYQHN